MKIKYLCSSNEEDLNERIREVSAAGRISRTKGKAFEVYENNDNYDSNLKFIKRVIDMGHTSIVEHDYLFFSIDDVTPIVEHTLIGFRLASFTVKSRREVDFRTNGFYVPDFRDINGNIHENNIELKKIYIDHMNYLFNEYSNLVDSGMKLEDARYVLPYSFNSNMFIGMDARTLLKVTKYLLYSKASNIQELKELGHEFLNIIDEYVPYLSEEVRKTDDDFNDNLAFMDEYNFDYSYNNIDILNKVKLLDYTKNSDDVVALSTIMERYQVSTEKAKDILEKGQYIDSDFKDKIIQTIYKNNEQRELEQVNFRFQIPIPLAVRTHLERHRIQSLVEPDFVPLWDLSNYDYPPSLKEEQKEKYDEIFDKNSKMRNYFIEQGVNENDLVYFYQAANMCNVITNINARSLAWISRMRCCTKAQFAIRKIVNQMCNQVKEVAPLIGKGLGASCDVFGICNEKKESCGKILLKKKDNNNGR